MGLGEIPEPENFELPSFVGQLGHWVFELSSFVGQPENFLAAILLCYLFRSKTWSTSNYAYS